MPNHLVLLSILMFSLVGWNAHAYNPQDCSSSRAQNGRAQEGTVASCIIACSNRNGSKRQQRKHRNAVKRVSNQGYSPNQVDELNNLVQQGANLNSEQISDCEEAISAAEQKCTEMGHPYANSTDPAKQSIFDKDYESYVQNCATRGQKFIAKLGGNNQGLGQTGKDINAQKNAMTGDPGQGGASGNNAGGGGGGSGGGEKGGEDGKGDKNTGGMGDMMKSIAPLAALGAAAGMAGGGEDKEQEVREEIEAREEALRQEMEDMKAIAEEERAMAREEMERQMKDMQDAVANANSGLGCAVDFTNCQSQQTQSCGAAGIAVCCSATDPQSGAPLYGDQYNSDFCSNARTNAARSTAQSGSGMFGVGSNGAAAGGNNPFAMGGNSGQQMPNIPSGMQMPNIPNNGATNVPGNSGDVGSGGSNIPSIPAPNFNIARSGGQDTGKPQLAPSSQNNFSNVSKALCREYRKGGLIATSGYGCAR